MLLYSFLSDFDKSNLSEATRLQKVTIQLYFNSPLATERHALLYCKSTDLCFVLSEFGVFDLGRNVHHAIL